MDHNYIKIRDFSDADPPKKVTKYCSAPQCSNYYREGLSFHIFPSNDNTRKLWEVALKMGKSASNTMLVCGDHFTPGDYFPSGKLPILK